MLLFNVRRSLHVLHSEKLVQFSTEQCKENAHYQYFGQGTYNVSCGTKDPSLTATYLPPPPRLTSNQHAFE